MFSTKWSSLGLAALIATASAGYSSSSKNNVAVYYGQGPNEGRPDLGGFSLASFCDQSSIDIIVLGFVNVLPSEGNGYPGTNFGSNCWAGNPTNYPGPGWAGVKNPANDHLLIDCHLMTKDIQHCKAVGKTLLLSVGGATDTYHMTDDANQEGIYTADFLWNAFGPYNASWTGPRPFDYNGVRNSVDGFDFDIEHHSSDVGYIKMIARLRSKFPAGSNYLITGAPQCVYPDANMGNLFSWVVFDMLFIQFYNSDPCSARGWTNYNVYYGWTGKEGLSYFSYRQWASGLQNTVNKNTKLFIGLLGSTAATSPSLSQYYLNTLEADNIIQAYYCEPTFGGVMIYEATYSQNNTEGVYHQSIKNSLLKAATNPRLTCSTKAATKNNMVVQQQPSSSSSTLSTITTKTSTTVSSTTDSTTTSTTTTTLTSTLSKPTVTSTWTSSSSTSRSSASTATATSTSTTTTRSATATPTVRSSRFRRVKI